MVQEEKYMKIPGNREQNRSNAVKEAHLWLIPLLGIAFLLWYIKNEHLLNLYDAEQEPVTEVPRHHDNSALPISTDIHDIFDLALNQNFVPVVDDRGIFIGIITRKNILQHCCNIDR